MALLNPAPHATLARPERCPHPPSTGWGAPASPHTPHLPLGSGRPPGKAGGLGEKLPPRTLPLGFSGLPTLLRGGPRGLTENKVTIIVLIRELWAGLWRGAAALGDLAVAGGLVAGLAEPPV